MLRILGRSPHRNSARSESAHHEIQPTSLKKKRTTGKKAFVAMKIWERGPEGVRGDSRHRKKKAGLLRFPFGLSVKRGGVGGWPVEDADAPDAAVTVRAFFFDRSRIPHPVGMCQSQTGDCFRECASHPNKPRAG